MTRSPAPSAGSFSTPTEPATASEQTADAHPVDKPRQRRPAISAVLADWGVCLEQLPERTVIEAHIATDRRIAEKLRRYSLGNRAKVVTR